MHLSQIRLSYSNFAKLRIRDSYEWHQKLWLAFPNSNGGEREFLTRVDRLDNGDYRALILSAQTPVRPQWCLEEAWQSKEIPASYLSFRTYHFSLLANPTRKVNKQRIPISTREGLVEWLGRKGEQSGFIFDPNTLRTIPRPREYFRRKGIMGLHSALEFSGVLQVTDQIKFGEAFRRGIGSGKAFGFGMLTLVPERCQPAEGH